MAILSISDDAKLDWRIWIGLLGFQVVIVLLYAMKLGLFLVLPIFVILFFFFASDFRYCLYLFIFSLFLGQYLFPSGGARVADFILGILIFSYLVKGALEGKIALLKTPLDKPILIFLSVLAISLVNAVDLGIGIKSFSRHLQLFALFYVIQSEIKGGEVKKFLQFFLFMTVVHSLYNLSLFVLHTGKIRAYGFAGVPFADMLVTSLIICYSFYLLQKRNQKRFQYAMVFFILLGALFATQTRGAMISFFLSYTFVSIIALKRRKLVDSSIVHGNFLKLTISMMVLIILAFLLFIPLVTDFSRRFYFLYQLPVTGAQETIQIRFFLWETALKTFFTHPFLGIGIGQFIVVQLIVPSLRFSPLSPYITGLDAHNIVLSYLSQTGLLGLGGLLYFMSSFLKVGLSTNNSSFTIEDLSISTSLLGILFFVVASSFYAGAWFYSLNGMAFMFFLALTVAFHRTRMTQIEIKDPEDFAKQ
jgi:O-antigen ligase